jgi:methionyl-tRNA formyltransferase
LSESSEGARVRAVFMGTPEFSVPVLDALAAITEVVGVVCQPDRPSGRGMHLTPPPVKVRAQALGLELIQPTKVRDGTLAAWIHERRADVALVVAYGRILPRPVLDAPRVGCLNVHASILPKYRGAAPIAWAIARGETETGVDLMRMDEGMDTGPVLAEKRLAIGDSETTAELSQRLSQLAAELVRETLLGAVEGALQPRAQDHSAATTAPMLKKEDGVLDFRRGARALHDHVRAMSPWPSATTRLAGKTLRVLRTRVVMVPVISDVARAPGVILVADKHGAIVACGPDGGESLAIAEAQVEGKRAMSAGDLANGRVLVAGGVLGSQDLR